MNQKAVCGCEGDEKTHDNCKSTALTHVVKRSTLRPVTPEERRRFGESVLAASYVGGDLYLCTRCAIHYYRRGYRVEILEGARQLAARLS